MESTPFMIGNVSEILSFPNSIDDARRKAGNITGNSVINVAPPGMSYDDQVMHLIKNKLVFSECIITKPGNDRISREPFSACRRDMAMTLKLVQKDSPDTLEAGPDDLLRNLDALKREGESEFDIYAYSKSSLLVRIVAIISRSGFVPIVRILPDGWDKSLEEFVAMLGNFRIRQSILFHAPREDME